MCCRATDGAKPTQIRLDCALVTYVSPLRCVFGPTLFFLRESHIQKKIKAQLLEAKAKSGAKDKRGALFALKRKKMYEGEVNKLNGARMTLESQVRFSVQCNRLPRAWRFLGVEASLCFSPPRPFLFLACCRGVTTIRSFLQRVSPGMRIMCSTSRQNNMRVCAW